jgi:p-aminobenzoyl-glutamate transporter AbgT
MAIQWAASKGYNILPLNWLQKYVKNADLGRMVSEHRPFKISFGAMMAMAAFAQL